MRCWYRTAETYGGDYLEVDAFPVWAAARKPIGRRAKHRPTSEAQALYNAKLAERKLVRLIHANFGERDYSITLNYDAAHHPDDDEGFKRDVRNFHARLRRLYARLGVTLKYICVCAHGKRGGRCHVHMIVSGGVPREEIEKLWTLGRWRVEPLQFDADGVAGLSNYIIKQAEVYAKRWCSSRNLIHPEPVVRDDRVCPRDAHLLADMATSPAKLYELAGKLWPGYQLSSVQSQNIIDRFGGAYFTLRLIRIGSKHAAPDREHWSDAWLKRVAMQRDGEVDGRESITVRDGRPNAARSKAAKGTAALSSGRKKRRRGDGK